MVLSAGFLKLWVEFKTAQEVSIHFSSVLGRQSFRRFLNRDFFRFPARGGFGAGNRGVGVDIRHMAIELLADFVGGDIDLSAIDFLQDRAIILGAHDYAPFSTGALTRLPHSVHEPS